MTHTPGPWHRNIKPARKYSVIFAGRNTHVARVVADGLTDDEIEANCNLLTAAPELLAAARAIDDAASEYVNTGFSGASWHKLNVARARLREVIAEAEGFK